jgi:hypothetical protein
VSDKVFAPEGTSGAPEIETRPSLSSKAKNNSIVNGKPPAFSNNLEEIRGLRTTEACRSFGQKSRTTIMAIVAEK